MLNYFKKNHLSTPPFLCIANLNCGTVSTEKSVSLSLPSQSLPTFPGPRSLTT